MFLKGRTKCKSAKALSNSSRRGRNPHGNAQGGNSTLKELESFTLPEPDAFHPKILQKNMTELMSKPLGVILGKSWGVNKHQKTGEEQIYSVFLRMEGKD